MVNGAQIIYKHQFGIGDSRENRSTWLVGVVNSAPYLCCAVIGCWLTVPFNHWFGRRGTIFLTCGISAIACFWQSFVNTWWHMFVARFVLGLGIGPKSATVPIYAAETTPPAIRGALVMQWQMWTAFGIMLGYAADLAFFNVVDPPHITGLNWRLMMGSAMLPAIVGCAFVFFVPESPRWYLSNNRHDKAYEAICRVRFAKVQAARDQFYMYTLLEAESNMKLGQNKVMELIAVPRNRRALLASEIVMFMQQVYFSLFVSLSLHSPNPVNIQLVLRGQRHRILFVPNLPRRLILTDSRPLRISRIRRRELDFRHSGSLHNRYFRSSKSPPLHLPSHVYLPVLHRLFLLYPEQRNPCSLRRLGNLSLRSVLFSW